MPWRAPGPGPDGDGSGPAAGASTGGAAGTSAGGAAGASAGGAAGASTGGAAGTSAGGAAGASAGSVAGTGAGGAASRVTPGGDTEAARRPRPVLSAIEGGRHPAVRHLVVLACYLAAGIAVTWPRAAYLVQGKLPDYLDVVSYTWDLWWVAHQVTHLGNPFFTGHMAAPVGIQLGFDTLIPLLGLVMTPVTLAFGPSASLSLLTIVAPGLACYAMYRVARLWLRSQAGAIAAGACFGLCSMLDWQDWYHIQLSAGMVLLPVTLEAAVRFRRSQARSALDQTPRSRSAAGRAPRGRRAAVVLGLALGASLLVNQEIAVMALILAALALVPWLLATPSRALARLRPLALGALAAVVVASPQIAAMAWQLASGGAAVSPHLLASSDASYGTGLGQLFAPSPRTASFGLPALSSSAPVGEGMPGYGVVLTALAAAGLVAGWRRGSAWRLAGLWLGCSALALGVTLYVGNHETVPLGSTWEGVRVSLLMPYTWLIRIPGLAAFRDAARLALLGLVGAALLAGNAVEWLRDHARYSSARGSSARGSAARGLISPVLIASVAVLGVFEAGWSGNPGPPAMPTALPALDRPIAADHSGSVVLDIPFGLRGGLPLYGSHLPNAALLIATADGHPRAISYSAFEPPPTIAGIARHPFYAQLVRVQYGVPLAPAVGHGGAQVTAAQLAAARRDLRRLDIGWALVWPPAGAVVERYLTATGFRLSYTADGVTVFRLPGTAG